MAADSYSQALLSRRGKSLDPSLLIVSDQDHDLSKGKGLSAGDGEGAGRITGGENTHSEIDARAGATGSASAGGERVGTPHSDGETQYDRESTTHMDEHTKVANEGRAMSAPANRESSTHMDEHTKVPGEMGREMSMPRSQSPGEDGGELASDIRDHIGGHASAGEYEQLKGLKPRSLGERAKMDVLKAKFSPAGSVKNG